MPNNSLALVTQSNAGQYDVSALIELALRAVPSENSKRAYKTALTSFIAWCSANKLPFSRQTVLNYRAKLSADGLAASSINQRLSAIRALAREAKWEDAIDARDSEGVQAVKGVEHAGKKTGNWLTEKEANLLLDAPDVKTLKGRRDRVILAILIGCGLRRSELVSVKRGQLQQRDGRWVFADLKGKGKKFRTVPVPAWCVAIINQYYDLLAKLFVNFRNDCPLIVALLKGQNLKVPLSAVSTDIIWQTVKHYAGKLANSKLAPHDCRRTFGRLAHTNGASVEQLAISMGHSDPRTTIVYLGIEQSLTDAPCDHLGLSPKL